MVKYRRGGTRYSGTQGETRNTVLREYQHIPCTGTKGLAIEVNHLNGNGGSAVYKGIDMSLSLGGDWGSLPRLTWRKGECEGQREMGDWEGETY